MVKVIVVIGIFSLLQACSGASVKQQQASVTSIPSGATVYANGRELGVTPLHQNLYKAFPASWNDWVLTATGALIVKMNGCKDFVLDVNDAILSKPIHAKLECSEVIKPVIVKQPIVKPSVPKAIPARQMDSSTEKRLMELERLYKKGVVTKEEYQTTRKRILNEL